MIKLQLNELLGDRSHWWLSQQTGISHSTIRRLASPKSERIYYTTLSKLCAALDCQPGDLLVVVPNTLAATKRPRGRVASKRG